MPKPPNIDELTDEQMEELSRAMDRRKETYLKRCQALNKEFTEKCEAVGLKLSDVWFQGKEHALKGTKKKIKYRNPDNHEQTWSGQGNEPKWMQPYLAKGKTKNDFLIVAAKANGAVVEEIRVE